MLIDDKGGDLLLQLLKAAEQRARVLAGNLANQNTPGFKRRDLQFEELLAGELERGTGDTSRVRPEVVVDELTPARADGNNVNLEEEHASIRENLLRYEMYAAILQGRANLLRSAIHGERP